MMKTIWFKKSGWLYVPVHGMGLLITLLAIVFMVPVCVNALRNGHSVSDGLYQIFIYGSCTVFWWKWIAEKTS
ncbi:MAG: hypothetical protein HC867_09065 [Bacteroidia bacterium]|nr:hypothetical protein [Bacteroidia bacterium]